MTANDATARVAALFDVLAESYDSVGVDFFQPIAAGLIEAMPPQPGERWLDIGCGRGAVTFQAAAALGPLGHVTGIDLSPRMAELAQAEAAARGLANVTLALGNAMDPQLPEATFDAISSCLVLFFLPDPAHALKAWLPLLVPGGRLGVTTFGDEDERWRALDELFAPYLPPAMLDARTSGNSGPFASDPGMEDLARAAGFVDARTMSQTVAVRFDDADAWYRFSWSTGQRQFWLAVPEGKRDDVRAEAFDQLSSFAADDGSITLSMQIRHTLARRPHA